jgi:hypothetical protein
MLEMPDALARLARCTKDLSKEAKTASRGLLLMNRAAASCFGSSPVSRRTNTLVSTAIMASRHFPANGGAHLHGRFRFAPWPQTAGDLFEIRIGKVRHGTEQNSFPSFFDRESSKIMPQRAVHHTNV